MNSILRLWRTHITYPDTPPQMVAEVQDEARRVSIRLSRLSTWGTLAMAVLFWPTDFWAFHNAPDQIKLIAVFRIGSMVWATTCALLLWLSPLLRQHAVLMLALTALGASATQSLALTPLDRPDIWFPAIYIYGMITVPLLLPFWKRVVVSFANTAIWTSAFLWKHPQMWDDPRLRSLLLLAGFSAVVVILIGHTVYHLWRQNLLQSHLLRAEQQRSEHLLLNILPAPAAQRLLAGERLLADRYEDVSVLFADLCGFTVLSEQVRPEAIVQMLNDIFSRFDEVISRLGLEKIKTIGDAYMVAGGLHAPRADHLEAIAEAALAMRDIVRTLRAPDGQPLAMRIGIHVGPVVAGIIGQHRFIYDLWGDTVNFASRMESSGVEDHIQVSSAVAERLSRQFRLESRGLVLIKGKGELRTFFLIERTLRD